MILEVLPMLAITLQGQLMHSRPNVIARAGKSERIVERHHDQAQAGSAAKTDELTLVLRPDGGSEVRFQLSQQLFRGLDMTETVPALDCKKRLADLSARLAQFGFSGVVLHPERCDLRDRQGQQSLVEIVLPDGGR